MPDKNVVLLGDSTIDNQVWVGEGHTVTEKLQALRPNDNFTCLAIDGFTTRDVLYGAKTDKAVSSDRHNGDYFEPLTELHKLPPLNTKISAASRQASDPVDHIILSVGGNDFREELRKLTTMDADERVTAIAELSSGISDRYLDILDKIKELHPQAKITALLQYTPNTKNDVYFIYFLMSAIAKKQTLAEDYSSLFSAGMHYITGLSAYNSRQAVEVLHDIMENVYRPILKEFVARNISVIDLASSFDENDPSLYVSQIEPSAKGSELIAGLISEMLDCTSEQSLLISKPYKNLDSPSQLTPLKYVADHWRPGHVFINKDQAMAAFLTTYNPSPKTSGHKVRLFSPDEFSNLQSKTLNDIVSDVQQGHASSKTIKIMQQLKFLDYKGEFTDRSAVYPLVSEKLKASINIESTPL